MEGTIPAAPSTASDMCSQLRTCSKNKGERWKLEALHWVCYCATEIWLLNHSDNILCLISTKRLLRSSPGHTVSLFNNSIGDIEMILILVILVMIGDTKFLFSCWKNISLVRCAHSWNIFQHSKRNFVSPRGHVISSIYCLQSGFHLISKHFEVVL